jgi:hypothetical protein
MCGQLHHPHGNAQVFAAAGALMQGQIFVFISFVTLTAAAASERVVQCSAVFLLLVADMISMYLPIYLTRMQRPRNHAD